MSVRVKRHKHLNKIVSQRCMLMSGVLEILSSYHVCLRMILPRKILMETSMMTCLYVNRDFNKVDKFHYKFGAFTDSTMRTILGSVQQVLE